MNMTLKTDGHKMEIWSIENNTKAINTGVKRGALSRFLRVKVKFFSVRDSRTVTISLNIIYIPQYIYIYKCILFSDPVVFFLNLGLLTSKKEECVQYAFNNFDNTSFIPAQVKLLLINITTTRKSYAFLDYVKTSLFHIFLVSALFRKEERQLEITWWNWSLSLVVDIYGGRTVTYKSE